MTDDGTASPDEARAFAAAFRRFLEWVHSEALLGVPADQTAPPAGMPVRGADGHTGFGWAMPAAYGPGLDAGRDD